ncbi:MAG: hypothetical protein JK586_06755 [Nocardiopsis sp. BM-2018]|nr:MAG: hypothetical protein JK586_06755 [Nocardiopsis sp. BM-2018]
MPQPPFQNQPPQQHGPPPQQSGYPGTPPGQQPPTAGRRPRTALTVALTAGLTLAVLGSLTWAFASSYGSSTGVGAASGLPTDDPCAGVDEVTLSRMDGEISSWQADTYNNGCSWVVTLGEHEDTSLSYSRSVPMSGADADFAEELDDEVEVPRDVDSLYELMVEDASELSYESDSIRIFDSRDRQLDFGDESVIVLADISYSDDEISSQRVNVIVREGRVVSQLSYSLSVWSIEPIDLDEAEDLVRDITVDLFG